MRISLLTIVFVVVLSFQANAQTRPEWKGGYLQKLEATEKTIQFELQNDQIIDSVLIQKFGNHKWSQVEMVQNKKSAAKQAYESDVFWFQGENRYRLKYYVMDTIYYSKVNEYDCNRDPIQYEISKDTKTITFSAFAEFSIWSALGAIMMKSSGETVDISGLDQGVYYLLLDGRTEKFLKR